MACPLIFGTAVARALIWSPLTRTVTFGVVWSPLTRPVTFGVV
ncbi:MULTISPECIES: hypothetical protein [Streptomyces]|nr:hypothetical protein [Streptomyces sp. WI03-4A]MDX2590881.1 hypothetical protein [Streptomyces sp. WI03-4A]